MTAGLVIFGVLTLEQASAAVDFDVLIFLLGLMLVVGYVPAVLPWRNTVPGRPSPDLAEFARVGVPVTLLTLAWGIAVLVALR